MRVFYCGGGLPNAASQIIVDTSFLKIGMSMPERLCGREQEYGLTIFPIPRSCRDDDEVRSEWRDSIIDAVLTRIPLVAPALAFKSDFNYWLSNGSRIYKDQQSLEAAGAEHLAGSLDGILQEKATELILLRASQMVVNSRHLKVINFYKNNVGPGEDEIGNSIEVTYGSHHNYSYAIEKRKEVIRLLLNFIPATLPLSGNGHIYEVYEGKFVYCFSQRANHLERLAGSCTTAERAIINTREEPLMDSSCGLSRMHLISRDATRCELQTWLVDTITHLVLRLAEEGWRLPHRLTLKRPIADIHSFNTKFDLDYRFQLQSRSISAVEYNYLFLRAARQLKPLSVAEKKCLEEWERILELLKAKAVRKLVGELDWATKWFLLENQMKKWHFGLNSSEAFKINMEYHNISASPRKSIFALLNERGLIKHLVDPKMVQEMVVNAPQTRARSRGEFIRRCLRDNNLRRQLQDFDWQSAKTITKVIYFGGINNPFSSHTVFGPYDPNAKRHRFPGNFEFRP
ncbi:MAG: proteasome accessory factor PafA2 family protein [Candidatus Harrisonbacteria bacterium]|nr:proteasome accessory factor PafA2 family protein [Candidatus Harrisonbacteria bacterium]